MFEHAKMQILVYRFVDLTYIEHSSIIICIDVAVPNRGKNAIILRVHINAIRHEILFEYSIV